MNLANNQNWRRNLLIVVVAIVAVTGLSLLLWQFLGLKLIKTLPIDASMGVDNRAEIAFEFNKRMATSYTPRGEDASNPRNVIELEPYVDGHTTVKDNRVIFTPEYNLRPFTKYKATLVSAKPGLGKGEARYTITFTTGQGKFSDQDPASPRNKFIKSLPYTTNAYSIDYLVVDNMFVVQIFEAPVEGNKQAVLDYLFSQGVDVPPNQVSYYVIPLLGNTSGP